VGAGDGNPPHTSTPLPPPTTHPRHPGVIGLIPGGDLWTAGVLAYVAHRGGRLPGVTEALQRALWRRAAWGALLSLIPGVAALADAFYKPNRRNVDAVLRHFGRQPMKARQKGRW
jgi:hypothetical protein